MKEIILNVNYIIDGSLSVMPTKMFYEQSDENEMRNIHYEINSGKYNIISEIYNNTEYAILYLQKVLPTNINIACCQSCRHGNFCPYGDNDNEVFCFNDITPNNKYDVCEVFSENSIFLKKRSRKLLDFCIEYKPISHDEYYTYNSWGYKL